MLFSSDDPPLAYRFVPADQVRLVVRKSQPNAVNVQALVQGRLWLVDGCVKIGETASDARTVIWRSGIQVGEDARGIFIFHPARTARHRIGANVHFGGGYVETLEPDWVARFVEKQSLMACQGPFVFVDTMGD